MKKITGLALTFIAFAMSVSAMQIGPVSDIGWCSWDEGPTQGMLFKGYTSAQATPHYSRRTGKLAQDHFDEGTVYYGDRKVPLCFHIYKSSNKNGDGRGVMRAGGLDVENTWKVGFDGYVFTAKTDEGGILYFYCLDRDVATQMICFGYTPGSSKIYKYFDTDDMKKDSTRLLDVRIFKGDFVNVKRDTIVIPYRSGSDSHVSGALYYKWDEAAQWFSVEDVPY